MINPAAAVLGLLVHEDRVWGIEEPARELGDRTATLDGIAELDRAGLLNRINTRFVCASRAPIAAARISGEGPP